MFCVTKKQNEADIYYETVDYPGLDEAPASFIRSRQVVPVVKKQNELNRIKLNKGRMMARLNIGKTYNDRANEAGASSERGLVNALKVNASALDYMTGSSFFINPLPMLLYGFRNHVHYNKHKYTNY